MSMDDGNGTSMGPGEGAAPSVNVLAGRHVIFVDLGVEDAYAAARALFAQTMAVPVQMGLDQHDRLCAGYRHMADRDHSTADHR